VQWAHRHQRLQDQKIERSLQEIQLRVLWHSHMSVSQLLCDYHMTGVPLLSACLIAFSIAGPRRGRKIKLPGQKGEHLQGRNLAWQQRASWISPMTLSLQYVFATQIAGLWTCLQIVAQTFVSAIRDGLRSACHPPP
jgi:hypothetical protein